MSEIKIALRNAEAEFSPGEEISGGVQWVLDYVPKSVEVRIFWRTSGRAVEDLGIVETIPFDGALAEDTRSFKFTAPLAPYSFSGSLITLNWAVEVVALPKNDSAEVDLVIAPGGKALELKAVKD